MNFKDNKQKKLYNIVKAYGPIHIDNIISFSNLTSQEVNNKLNGLVIKKYINKNSNKVYSL